MLSSTVPAALSIVFGRRSIRTYESRPVYEETVSILLQAAMAAPSACCRDPWRFVVVREKAMLSLLAQGLPHGSMLAYASLGIVVCGDINAAHDRQLSYLLQDCSASIENLLIAAHALKLGACWLGIHPRADRIKHVSYLLSLPESVIPIACISLGYPAESKEPRTRYLAEYVHYEKW